MSVISTDNEPADPAMDGGLVRVRLDLAYDGTHFVGWAKQRGLRSVQQTVSVAIGQVLRLPEPPVVTCAGRTDSGVHARGQVAHVDVPTAALGGAPRPVDPTQMLLANAVIRQFEYRLRSNLPDDITLKAVEFAPPGFDARFSALWRQYRYRVCDDITGLDPWRRVDTLVVSRPLDVDAMNEAATVLKGRHDFAAFCRKREGATTIRTLLNLEWTRIDPAIVELVIRADAFCHSMVRAIVGAMLAVGEGRRDVEWLGEYLAAGVRGSAVAVVRPHGLVLEHVEYPQAEALAQRAIETRAIRRLDDEV